MRNKIMQFFAGVSISVAAALPAYAMEKFTIDKAHSYLLWHVNHLGFSDQSGKWYVTGTLELDKQNPKNSKVEVVIAMDSLITGDPELDKHLKSKQFFDVARYSQATFKSDKVELDGKDKAKITGMLTLHGVTKPVTLSMRLNKEGMNLLTDRKTVGFTGSTEIKRSEFGMKNLIPLVSDTVRIDINAEAYQPKT